MDTLQPGTTHPCKVCGVEIANPRDRRNLHSSANQSVLSLIEELFSRTEGGGSGQLRQLLLTEKAWICKSPCFQSIQRCVKLREDVQRIEQTMLEKLTNTHDLVLGDYSASRPPGPPSPKRPRLLQQRRLAFGSTGGSSPAVSVSLL